MAVANHMGYCVRYLDFRAYGGGGEVTLSQLIEMGDVFANVETSGSESCRTSCN